MALRVAVANGNWSNPSTWYFGVKPAAGDIVASNGYTVTIDENVNVDTITNTSQFSTVSIIPIMTSNTTPSGVVSTNNYFQNSATYEPWKAFDGSVNSNGNHWYTNNNPVFPWLEYQFSSAKTVVGYTLQNTYANLPNSWEFQAWNGSIWIVLDTVTGNTSLSGPIIRTFTNTVAYTRYRIYVTVANGTNVSIGELRMVEEAVDAALAVAGGGFVISSSVTVTCTSVTGIQSGASTVLTISATSPAIVNINSNLTIATSDNVSNVLKSGNCTLNIVGSTRAILFGSSRHILNVNAAGTVNFIGEVTGAWSGTRGILMNSGSTGAVLNITGDVNPGKLLGGAQNAQHLVITSTCTVNITGNVYGDFGNSVGILVNATSSIYVTGGVYGGANSAGGNGNGISSSVAGFISVVGIISAQHSLGSETPAIASTSLSAINLFSGPFVSGPYGTVPFLCARAHLIPTTNSYFEFRDETTNGAVSPGAIAPATRLVSPATVGDNPIPANVRFGTVYSLGTLTGTLRMPTANQVTFGVAVDNTFGNAVLTAASVWDYLVANITVENSIGMRLKNVATPQTVGSQLASLL